MFLSAVELSRAIASKELSCVKVMEDTLEHIATLNPTLNAIVAMADAEQLIAQAHLADEALKRGEYWGWMHGIPHAIKDLANLQGFVNSFGSPIYKDNKALQDDIFVGRIRAQGAIFVGKTNVPEFGLGSQSYNQVYGSTKNAFDSTLTAGGSSGGAAAAIASGMLAVADGSDMMGSLRNPAAFNNVVGFRPGLGQVPSIKGDLFFEQLPIEGPMARTVTDLIALYTTMAGPDNRAPLSLQKQIEPPETYQGLDLSKARIGWMADFDHYLPMEQGILDHCETALKKLEKAGCTLDQIGRAHV